MPAQGLATRIVWNVLQKVRKTRHLREIRTNSRASAPPPVKPAWPLPRRPGGPADAEIRAAFARYPLWHYSYKFEGGLEFGTQHVHATALTEDPVRPLQRFSHFMPALLEAAGGSLAGKRVLDIACNSGFWSMQCALLGAAEVVGFDARPELIEQANLIKNITGANNASFRVLDFWDMSPERLGGTFDVVLSLGILYHLSKPLEALELTKRMSRALILLDTNVLAVDQPLISVRWEEPNDIRDAATPGIVVSPSKSSIQLMLRHMRVRESREIPVRTTAMPEDYLGDRRASWIIRV